MPRAFIRIGRGVERLSLGFTAIPPLLLGAIVLITGVYVCAAEILKGAFFAEGA